jgi:mannose/fructose/N-acetylgalactosamine-specific phosphotransferase system component IIC
MLNESILNYLFLAYDIYVSGVVMPVFVALIYNKWQVRRPVFCLVGIALGGIMGALAYGGNPNWSYLGMAVSSGLTLIGIIGKNHK